MRGKRSIGRVALILVLCAVLYLPIRREVLDAGLLPAASFQGPGGSLILYDDGRYELDHKQGKFTTEHYPEAPWISGIRLDSGQMLHVRYEDRVYRVEDIPELRGAEITYTRR